MVYITGISTQETFTSYLRGLNFWYTAVSVKAEDTTSFTGCNGSGKPEAFTEFENGKFQWLYKLYSSTGDVIADYKIESVTQFGGDSVYIVKYLPKQEETNKMVKTLNSVSDYGIFSFFSLEKTLYVRKRDFCLLRIDFVQRSGNLSESTRKHIKSINKLRGTVGFQYFNGSPHPAYIYEKISYQDLKGNQIERSDSCYYSNIRQINLSAEELKNKYQIKYIYRGFPIRSVGFKNIEKVGPFWYVPILK